MLIIKIFSDFCDSTTCKINFEKTCDSNNLDFYGLNKRVYITDKDDYTHAIILNKAMPILNIPKENVLGLAFEPIYFLGLTPEFVEYATNMTALDAGKFLRDRIGEGYYIYIQERV